MPTVFFTQNHTQIQGSSGTVLIDAIRNAGIEIDAPCGGRGTCGKCTVTIQSNNCSSLQKSCHFIVTEDISVLFFHAQSHILHPAVRTDAVFRPSGFRRTHNRPGPMVLVGKSARSGDLPDGHLVPMYDQRHSIHRIDPDSHSRGAGARHGRLFRSRRLRRTADAENRLRHSDDHSGRHPHHRRRQHNDLHDTLSETVPETPDPKTVTSLRSRAFLSVPVRHGPRATCAFTRGLIDARIPERCSRLLKRPISRRIFRPTAWQAITDKRMSR